MTIRGRGGGAKVPHPTYVGDATIGAKADIGLADDQALLRATFRLLRDVPDRSGRRR